MTTPNKSIEDVVEEFKSKFKEHLFLDMTSRQPLDASDRHTGYWNVGMASSFLEESLTTLVQQSKEEERDKVFEEFKDETLIGQVAFKKGLDYAYAHNNFFEFIKQTGKLHEYQKWFEKLPSGTSETVKSSHSNTPKS
jgi:hypothetical protein